MYVYFRLSSDVASEDLYLNTHTHTHTHTHTSATHFAHFAFRDDDAAGRIPFCLIGWRVSCIHAPFICILLVP